MKKLEVIIPDDMLRQVLVLVADAALELHVYAASPSVVEAQPMPKVIAAPARKPHTNKSKPKPLPDQTAEAIIKRHIQAHGSVSQAELKALGPPNNLTPETMVVQANKSKAKGILVKDEGGRYTLASAA